MIWTMRFRRPLNNRRFARRVRLAARYKMRQGDLSPEQYHRIVAGSKDIGVVKRWRTALSEPKFQAPWLESAPDTWTGINWSNLWDWLIDNWPTILRLLLSLRVFLGEDPTGVNTPGES